MSTTTSLSFFRPAAVKSSASSTGKPDPNNRKNASSNWWTPIFGLSSSEPDYINNPTTADSSESDSESATRSRSKYSLGCFTEEKAKQLRIKTAETSTFHDIMYHSAIASRLASDISKPNEK